MAWWLRYAVCALLGSVPLATQWQPTAASRRIQFSGYDWIVKDSDGRRVGPGNNVFSNDAISVDARGLTLRVFERNGTFHSAEVVSVRHFGYGTYRFEVASDVSRLAPDLVLGLFTWSDNPGDEGAHKELDVELGRWGDPDNDVAQFVVQPYTRPGNIRRFSLPTNVSASTHVFEWTPGRVHFTSEVGGRIVKDEVFTSGIPTPADENVRINLWISASRIRRPGDVVVTVRRFNFAPAH